MNFEINQHVKCIFKNGSIIEGIIQSWSKDEAILLSLHDDSLMVILHPSDDLILVKIVITQLPEKIIKKETPKEWREAKHDIRDKLQEVMSPTGDVDLDKMNINQLRELVHEQDKQLIVQKKREHFGTVGNVKRAMPYSDSLKIISNASHKLSGR
jgi:hypothetical protein